MSTVSSSWPLVIRSMDKMLFVLVCMCTLGVSFLPQPYTTSQIYPNYGVGWIDAPSSLSTV